MPIYEYGCTECGRHIEAFQKISDEPLAVCPDCGGELSKLISSTSFVLKGGGWYADGYASTGKETKEAGAPEKAEAKTDKGAGGSADVSAKSKESKTPAAASGDKG